MDIFKTLHMNRLIKIVALLAIGVMLSGCVYFNTFYNASKAFKEAESSRKEAMERGVRSAGGNQYKVAIEKTNKIIEDHPNSGLYDDALFINGVSLFWTDNAYQAEKRFRELLANFPNSKYASQAKLYLAQCKLKLDEEDDALPLFRELFVESDDRSIKAEAALALGDHYIEENDHENARDYFRAVVDSLGDSKDRLRAQKSIADSYFDRFRYRQALEGYREVLEYELTTWEEYQARYKIGECHYFLNDIEAGLDEFFSLAENDLFFDSLAATKLMIAQGYEWDGDLQLAEQLYEDVAVENTMSANGAFANYVLGLIHQMEYENYSLAKEYFDRAKSAGTRTEVYKDALERSSNIGKLQQYRDMKASDTAYGEDEIDKAAETQYLLAELYLTEMSKADSALQEFQFILENFTDSRLTPKAMIAMAQIHRDYKDDTTKYTELLRKVLNEYPRSDYVPEAINLLGLKGTTADTGYAEKYYTMAEEFVLEEEEIDSARYYWQLVVDSFPDSKFNTQAQYALLWLDEEYGSPQDSSLVYAFADFADLYADTEYGKAADQQLTVQPRSSAPSQPDFPQNAPDTVTRQFKEVLGIDDSVDVDLDSLRGVIPPEQLCAMGPEGEYLYDITVDPERFEHEFVFPQSAYSIDIPGGYLQLCLQLKLNSFGEVVDLRLITPSGSQELDYEVKETIRSAIFPMNWARNLPMDISIDEDWFVYKYMVPIPESIR